MHFWALLSDIGILLAASLLLAAIAIRLGLSPLIGYLVAGMFLGGSGSLKVIQSAEEIEAIAELGVSLLLFTLGLEFSWEKIKTFSSRIINAGLLQVLVTPVLVFGVCYALKFDWRISILIGLIITLSSTATVLRTLVDLAELESPHGRVSTSVLLLQDIAVIPFTLIVSLLATNGSGSYDGLQEKLLYIFGGSLALVAFLYVFIYKFSSPILSKFNLENNREMSILLTVIISIGSAWAAHQIGISPAIGAFIAGMMLGSSSFSTQITADISPLKVIFITLFFSSVGMVADPIWIFNNFQLVLGISLLVIFTKLIVSFLLFMFARNTLAVSFAAAFSISQIGEFSFVLGDIAKNNSLLSPEYFQIMVSVTIVILFVTPYMIKVAPVLALFFQKIFSSKSYGMSKVQDDSIKPDIFILGFGPAGQEVARQLRENYIERIRVFDLNKTSINKAQSMGLSAKVGDVRQMEILQHYGMSNAKLVIITIPSQEAALQTVDIVRRLAPCAHIQLRARYQIHLHNFESAGVHDVVDEEHTVGKAIGERASLFLQDLDTKTNDSNLSPESE